MWRGQGSHIPMPTQELSSAEHGGSCHCIFCPLTPTTVLFSSLGGKSGVIQEGLLAWNPSWWLAETWQSDVELPAAIQKSIFFSLHVSPCLIWFLLLSFAKELLGSMTTIDTPIQLTFAFFFLFYSKELLKYIFAWSAKTQMDKTPFSTKAWLYQDRLWILFKFLVTAMSTMLWSKPKLWYFPNKALVMIQHGYKRTVTRMGFILA